MDTLSIAGKTKNVFRVVFHDYYLKNYDIFTSVDEISSLDQAWKLNFLWKAKWIE